MTNTETMPRLRQYLRERGFEPAIGYPRGWDIFSEPGPTTEAATMRFNSRIFDEKGVSFKCRSRLHPKRLWRHLFFNQNIHSEQAVIDWLEANYPKS